MKLVESNGVLVATSMRGIIRSTDDGENWALVISEGGVGIDVERIQGGFAAITFNTQSNTRRVRTSYDGGKTWQPIDAGLPGQAFDVLVDNHCLKLISLIRPGIPLIPAIRPGIPLYRDSTWNPINTSLPEQAFITSIVQVGEILLLWSSYRHFQIIRQGKNMETGTSFCRK